MLGRAVFRSVQKELHPALKKRGKSNETPIFGIDMC